MTASAASFEPIVLPSDGVDPRHQFTDPHHYISDCALLGYMLQDMRALVRRRVTGDVQLGANELLRWDVHGLTRRIVLCDPEALAEVYDFCVVGFFGERRLGVDPAPVEEVDRQLIADFPNHPGMLGYMSMELVDHYWTNLVLHTRPEDIHRWSDSPLHIRATEQLSPGYYRNVRIHRGRLPGGVVGSGPIEINSTRYWDYDSSPAWRAVRILDQPL